MGIKCELYHDNFQNYKRYQIPKAQLVIADIPYNSCNVRCESVGVIM